MMKVDDRTSGNYANKGPPLRPYQQEALAAMKNYSGSSALVVMGTGLGKTRVFTDYIRWEVLENDHVCLVLSHREELVRQALGYLEDLPCGIELGKYKAHPGRDKVISASVQSIVNRLKKYNPLEIDTIIIDEAHHAAAKTYRKILAYFRGAKVFGFTATAHRSDGVGLGCVFQDLLFERNVLWGIENGYLTPINAVQVRLKYDLGAVQVREETGDFDEKQLAKALSGTALGVAEAFEKYAKGPTIIFAVSVNEAQDIAACLNKKAGKCIAACITAKTGHRNDILNAYIQKEIQVIVNYGILTEGTDLPLTETILIARPVAHTNVGLYAQMVGRGLRLFPGKSLCQVIDCIGISDYPLCTAATLIGKEVSEKEDMPEPSKEKEPLEDQPAVLDKSEIPATWIRHSKAVDVVAHKVGTDDHNIAWFKLNDGSMVLSIPGIVYRVSAPLTDGTVYLWKNHTRSHNPKPLQFVLDYVYTDLKTHHAKEQQMWDKTRRKFWDKGKITEAQANLLKKLAPGYNLDTRYMTRGDASTLIQFFIFQRKGGKKSHGKATS